MSESSALPHAGTADADRAHPAPRDRRPLLFALATVAIVGAALLFHGLSKLGIWDPYELGLADLGCRKAAESGKLDLLSCGVEAGAKVADPRPAVMVQSVAIGFRLLGVTEVAGRVPFAVWILAAAIVLTIALNRLVDARAGLFAGIAMLTMPMVLAQGRLMLGDAATMGSFAIAFAGLAVAVFDRDETGAPTSLATRLPYLVLGALGVALGIGCRGIAVGCAPAFAVGLTALVRSANTPRNVDARAPLSSLVGLVLIAGAAVLAIKLGTVQLGQPKLQTWTYAGLLGAAVFGFLAQLAVPGDAATRAQRAVSGASLAVGSLGVLTGGIVALGTLSDGGFVSVMGAVASTSHKFPTFDLLVRQIAHGAFPWSCFIPFAIGRALATPSGTSAGGEARETDLRIAALLAATIAFVVQGLTAPHFGIAPYAAPAALAVLVAVVLRDLERAPTASLAIAIGTAILVGLVIDDYMFEDLAKTPVELATAPMLEAYGVLAAAAPEDLRNKVRLAFVVAGAVFLLPMFFVWVDGTPTPGWTRFEVALKPIRAVRTAAKHPYHSLWLLLAASFEVCIAIVGLVTFKMAWRRHIPQLQLLSLEQRKIVANLWWLLPLAVGGLWVAWVGFLYGRDVFRAARRQRVATIAVGGLVAAAVWSFDVMPAVANQFSPKNVFAVYRRVGPGAPVALLGVSPRTATYELDAVKPTVLADARAAYEWLTRGDAPRKFVALRVEQLPELNHLFREKSEPRINLPVLDGRTSQVLLASNLPGDTSENPLDRLVMSALPTATTRCNDPAAPLCAPAHLIDCDIDGKLQCLAWDMLDDNGVSVTSVRSAQHVRLRLFFKVTAKVSGAWQIFEHVEQPESRAERKTNDHVPLNGKYAMEQWLPGDIVVDDSDFSLEPSMVTGVPIKIYTGFFTGSTRMPLVSGPDAGPESDGMRLVLGTIPVK